MSDIFIDPAKGPISIKVEVNTLQVLSFEMMVLAPNGNDELEHYLGNSQTSNPFLISLNPPASYKDCYFATNFVIIDPLGAGNNYLVHYSVVQNGIDLIPVINISGVTTNGKILRTGLFHVKQ
jgi:hypothetical protein